jgi:hypothetical protein
LLSKPAPENGIISLEHDSDQYAAKYTIDVLELVGSSNFTRVKMSECVKSQNKGAAYATSGKLYELVTGRKSAGMSSTVGINDR